MKALLVLMLTFILASPAQAGEAPIPLAHFAKLPAFEKPVLSPNGEYIAVTVSIEGQPYLIVRKLRPHGDGTETKEDVIPIRPGEQFFFNWYGWANDDRLVFSIRGTTGFRGDLLNVNRMGSISRRSNDAVFFKVKPNHFGFYRQFSTVVDWLEKEPDTILAALDDEPDGWAEPRVHRVNVKTGKRQRVLKNRKGVYQWIADADGNVRVGIKYERHSSRRAVTVYYRETVDADWETLQKVDYFNHERLIPVRFDSDDPNVLLVTSASLDEAGGTEALEKNLFRYDLTQRKVTGPYTDTYRESILQAVEKALPGLEVEIASHDKAKLVYILRVYSDVQAPDYYVFDIKQKSLVYLASEYPQLLDAKLAPMERVGYTARDGRTIPAFLTLPNGAERKNLPLIVYPHGGPWAHNKWGFNNYVQFMASRGYAVLQPQFRGSTGYSREHEEAGYGQWGYAIQDDITDGVNWLIEQGIADAGRVCIVGSDFGGYAAAMGLAKTPELYRCGISINGVMDLKYFISSGRNLLFETIQRAMWNSWEKAEDASPYHMAENIKAPLLLIGSERDTCVPVKHSRKMYDELNDLEKPVEYVELPDGDHWRTNEAHEIMKFEAMERFLSRHLGAGVKAAASN